MDLIYCSISLSAWFKTFSPTGFAIGLSCPKVDTAMCNRAARPSLLELYKTMNFTEFLLNTPSLVHKKMRWTFERRIKFTDLFLTYFEQFRTAREFFQYNGPTLRTLHLSDVRSLNPTMSEWIAKNCHHLEALCIENCPLHMVIGDVLNTCPLKRLRLKSSFAHGNVPVKLLKSVMCPTVTELSLLDILGLKHLPTVKTSFPNVLDLEIAGLSARHNAYAFYSALFAAWPDLHTLRVHYAYFPLTTAWPLVPSHCAKLKKICFLRHVDCDPDALVQFFVDCTNLTSITIHNPHLIMPVTLLTPAHLIRIIEGINTRLEEFCLGEASYDNTVLVALARHCPNLRVLELVNENLNHEDRCIMNVYKQCPLIEQLHISINYTKSDSLIPELVEIATYCKNVHTLHFTQSQYVQSETS